MTEVKTDKQLKTEVTKALQGDEKNLTAVLQVVSPYEAMRHPENADVRLDPNHYGKFAQAVAELAEATNAEAIRLSDVASVLHIREEVHGDTSEALSSLFEENGKIEPQQYDKIVVPTNLEELEEILKKSRKVTVRGYSFDNPRLRTPYPTDTGTGLLAKKDDIWIGNTGRNTGRNSTVIEAKNEEWSEGAIQLLKGFFMSGHKLECIIENEEKSPKLPEGVEQISQEEAEMLAERFMLRGNEYDKSASFLMVSQNHGAISAEQALKTLHRHLGGVTGMHENTLQDIKKRFPDLVGFEGKVYLNSVPGSMIAAIDVYGVKDDKLEFKLQCVMYGNGIFPASRNGETIEH
ncbi:hypothetical protein HOE67_03155 [Candidatus Peregrinibacteria bacterium]|jgi:hypothetical protein|nr:hypothetical protein [Candidatus Peregrinibacteria bacterium]MBT4056084.1 hypothetical protein [Candidatus Peregrinibacteria bacterium]